MSKKTIMITFGMLFLMVVLAQFVAMHSTLPMTEVMKNRISAR